MDHFLTSFTYFDIITFLSSLNAMESLALSAKPSISSISPSPKSLCTTLSPMENFAIYPFKQFIKFGPHQTHHDFYILESSYLGHSQVSYHQIQKLVSGNSSFLRLNGMRNVCLFSYYNLATLCVTMYVWHCVILSVWQCVAIYNLWLN